MDIQDPKTLVRRVETDRFGPFTFQGGLDPQALELPLMCLQDAHRRFIGSPRSSCVKARPVRPSTATKRTRPNSATCAGCASAAGCGWTPAVCYGGASLLDRMMAWPEGSRREGYRRYRGGASSAATVGG